MSGLVASDARKSDTNASKAISTRELKGPQTTWESLLVRAVERGGCAEIKGTGSLLEGEQALR